MNYFMGLILEGKITGVEKAQINRLKLFLKNKIDAYCVYSAWNPYTYRNAQQFGISEHVFTMYDYFQESIYYKNAVVFDWINYWENECGYYIKYIDNSNDLKIYENKKYRMYVHFNDNEYKSLNYINYFDNKQNKIKRDIYDTKGFLNCTRILGENQKIIMENYYNPLGEIKLQKFYNINTSNSELSRIILKYKYREYFFNNENELIQFFYEVLYNEGDIFYIDRPYELNSIVRQINRKIPIMVVLHSTHLYNGVIKSIYSDVFKNLDSYKGIIVSTVKQKNSIKEIIKNKIPVYNINVGYILDEKITIYDKNINNNKIISVSRLVPDKQIEHQIRIIDEVRQTIPDVHLDIYGHGSGMKHINKLIKEYNLEKNIILHGFSNEIESALQEACLKIFTSKKEGFALSILESLSKGTPVISYDVDYGPNEMIENGKNGYLIEEGNEGEMAKVIISLLKDKKKLKKLSENCYTSIEKFSDKKTFFKWQRVINTIEQDEKNIIK